MSEAFDNFQLKKKEFSHLTLVVSTPPLVQKKKPSQAIKPNTGFTAEIRMRSPFYYALIARDPFHCLAYELILKIYNHEDEGELEPKSVICHFPNILSEALDEFIGGDETLYGMILIQFQMKILRQMLLFCHDHNTLNLIIYADDASEEHALRIYQSLTTYEDKFPTITGIKTKMLIPATQKTFDKLTNLINKVNQEFQQTLWENKDTNPSIRWYLKSNPDLKFFG